MRSIDKTGYTLIGEYTAAAFIQGSAILRVYAKRNYVKTGTNIIIDWYWKMLPIDTTPRPMLMAQRSEKCGVKVEDAQGNIIFEDNVFNAGVAHQVYLQADKEEPRELFYCTIIDGSLNSQAITHDALGTKLIKIEFSTVFYQVFGGEPEEYDNTDNPYTIWVNLPPIERKTEILTASNFNDEENPVITYSIPPDYTGSTLAKLQAALSFDGVTDDIAYRDIPTNPREYTFNLTFDEREILRKKVQGAKTVPIYFLIKTTRTNGTVDTEFITSAKRTLSIIGSEPTIAFSVMDIDTYTTSLTGDLYSMIKYHSIIQYEIHATASKNATITHQQITCGGVSAVNVDRGTLTNLERGRFVVTVADSRDNIAYDVIDLNLIDYVHLTCDIKRNSASPDGTISFNLSGNYFNNSFGAENNSLTLLYRYKANSAEDYSEYIEVTPTIKNNSYSIDIELSGLDYRETYTIQAEAHDKLEDVYSKDFQVSAVPIFDWSASDFNFNVPVSYTDIENNKTYNITNVVKDLQGVDLSNIVNIAGVTNAMSRRYELPCDVYVGGNYSSVTCNLYLYGNTIRGYLSAKRKSAVEAGNIANEYICGVEFDSGKKVTGFGMVSFCSGGTGGVATFNMQDSIVYPNDGSVDDNTVGKGAFKIYLAATATASDEWSCYFTFPALLDLNKF